MRFYAEVPEHGPGAILPTPHDLIDGADFADHTKYYDKGSESLYSMAEIVSGHADRLGQDGLLAPRKFFPVLGDLDSLHMSTQDHYHNQADKNANWGDQD